MRLERTKRRDKHVYSFGVEPANMAHMVITRLVNANLSTPCVVLAMNFSASLPEWVAKSPRNAGIYTETFAEVLQNSKNAQTLSVDFYTLPVF